MNRAISLLVVGRLACGVAFAEGLEYEPLGTVDVEVVLEITANRGTVTNVTASSPVLLNWPSQRVELLGTSAPSGVRVVTRREPGVAAWMEVSVSRIPAGNGMVVSRTYRVSRSAVGTSLPIASLGTVLKPSRAIRRHLGSSPGVQPRDRGVRELASSLVDDEATAGEKAIVFAGWVRRHVRYRFDPVFRGSSRCLESETGDCDDMSALFVALCRAARIPARSVWIEDHAYAEFLLVDESGTEHWVPVELAARTPIGTVRQTNPILQKGDGFVDPFTRRRVHYVSQGVRAVGGPVSFRSYRRITAAKSPDERP